MKTAQKILIVINLLLTIVYVAGVDSLSNYNVIAYGAILAVLWWLVKIMDNTTINKTKEE